MAEIQAVKMVRYMMALGGAAIVRSALDAGLAAAIFRVEFETSVAAGAL